MSMKKTENGKAEGIKDYSLNADGTRKDGKTEVTVEYTYEYDVLETVEEMTKKFSEADLLKLANARIKSTSNSAARQKAVAPYAIPQDDPAAIRERMIKDAIKLGKTKEQAEAFVDGLLAA
jgi:hypothetical protein